jgi:hypothetical protein
MASQSAGNDQCRGPEIRDLNPDLEWSGFPDRPFKKLETATLRVKCCQALAISGTASSTRQNVQWDGPMRYYFHLKSHNEILADDDGIDIEDSGGLRTAVMGALAEIIGQVPELLDRLSDWKVAVCTASGEVVFSIPLHEFSFQRVFATTSAHVAYQAGTPVETVAAHPY